MRNNNLIIDHRTRMKITTTYMMAESQLVIGISNNTMRGTTVSQALIISKGGMLMKDQAIIDLCLTEGTSILNKGARGQPGIVMTTMMINVKILIIND